MGRGKTLTLEEITIINTLKQEGYTNRQIAKRIKRSSWVINNYFKDPENYGRNRKGRTKMATTARERRLILREASNSTSTAREIRDKVGTSASIRTVRRVIANAKHLRRQKIKKKLDLKQHHKIARLEFCRQRMHWREEWKNVIFTDEKKFNLDGPDGFSYYFHDLRKEEKILPQRHRSFGCVMVWGAVSYYGPVALVVLKGKQTAEKYKTLLEQQIQTINGLLKGKKWVLQQDNAPIHTARTVKTWLENQNIDILDWPALSPDLNIIENVWGYLSRKVYQDTKQFTDQQALITTLLKTWNEIPQKYLESLYLSLPDRIFEVIKNKGGYTKY